MATYTSTLVMLGVAVAPASGSLAAQTGVSGPTQAPAAVTAAGARITAADLTRHLAVLAADSLQARATPSRSLEATARYLAGQFKQLGLQPHGDQTPKLDSAGAYTMVTITQPDGTSAQVTGMDTSFVQRYPLPGAKMVSPLGTQITFTALLQKRKKPILEAQPWPTEVHKAASISFATDAFFAADSVPQSGGQEMWSSYTPRETVVVAGPQTAQTVRAAQMQGKLVFYVPHAQADSATRRQIIDRLRASNFVVILSAEDSAAFAVRRQVATARPVLLVDLYMEGALGARYWAVEVRAGALGQWLTVAGVDPVAARTAATPIVRVVRSAQVALTLQAGVSVDSTSAPNVIGVIPGTDSILRNEYIVYSARLDHAPGAELEADHATGVAGLLELAKAFSQPNARPRRSVLFVALSGGAPDFPGAQYFVMGPSVGAANLTVNLQLGPLGRHAADSVTVAGSQELVLASRPEWVALQHPELGLAVADGGTILTADAEYVAFVRRALPSLYFFSGAGVGHSMATVNPEHATRALRLAFYVGQALANAPRSTTWTSAGRRDRVQFLGD